MRKYLFLSLLFGLQTLLSAVNPSSFEDVWKALEEQDRLTARKLLEKKLKNSETLVNATAALMLLNSLESRPDENLDLMKAAFPKMKNPSEYLFSLWKDKGVTSGYTKKEKAQEEFMYQMIADERVNGSIKGSAKYLLGMHHLWSTDNSKADELWEEIEGLKNWQLVGPFENTTGSGFDKNYPPVENSKSDSKFHSKHNADIHWFSPAYFQTEPYIPAEFYFSDNEAVIYAQTFVDNPEAKKIILGAGVTGHLKVWVNDKLIVSQEDEWRTDMDLHTYELELPKGNNRILVQLGFTSKTKYPNFIVRLLDNKLTPIKLESSDQYAPYNPASSVKSVKHIPHFSEAFFTNRIEENPQNILYHILLAKTYYRSNKFNEAIKVLEKALKIYPKNVLVHAELVKNYSSINDRTNLVKAIDDYRKLDDGSEFFAYFDYREEIRNQNYSKAKEYLDLIKKHRGETDSEYYLELIQYLSYKKEYAKMIELIEEAYQKHPNVSTLVEYKFLLEKNKENMVPTEILEKYLKTNYNGILTNVLIKEYIALGERKKAEKMMVNRVRQYPENIEFANQLINFYYKAENYEDALTLVERNLKNTPFSYGKWRDKSFIHEALGDPWRATSALRKAIHFNPNLFSEREKLREWEGKKPLSTYFDKEDTYELIEAALVAETDSDESYEYIFSEKNIAVFEEGPSIEHSYVALKILTNAGIEEWKEASVAYHSGQNLIISKAEVIKKNGQKIKAEQNQNELVFPNLEVGDGILIKYQLENYAFGKLRNEYWTKQILNDFVPIHASVFRFFVPHDFKFELKTENLEIEPNKQKIDDFTIYEWNLKNPEKIASEYYMPTSMEVGQSVYISTVKSWKTIAEWYRDLALTQAKEDYNLDKVYKAIFEDENPKSDYEKAKLIYDYLAKNVRYSSLPFRQNNYIPQKPMVTISTQLGDCKDLSTLYHTLARKAGLNTNLVLVNTKNNGEKNMPLPTTSFDHCIIKIDLEGGELFQELTDSKLPFGYIPETVRNAQGLVIPNEKEDKIGDELILIPRWEGANNTLKRSTSITIADAALDIKTEVSAIGPLASDYRYYFDGLTKEDMTEKVKSLTNSYFKNAVSLKDYEMKNLDNSEKEYQLKSDFKIEGEIISIGSMKAVKPLLFETLYDMEYFPEGDREYPLLLWLYYDIENYETEVTYELPEGEKWLELPEDISFNESFVNYNLTVEKLSDRKAKLTRKITVNKENLPADQYEKLREVAKAIIKAEDVYLVF